MSCQLSVGRLTLTIWQIGDEGGDVNIFNPTSIFSPDLAGCRVCDYKLAAIPWDLQIICCFTFTL